MLYGVTKCLPEAHGAMHFWATAADGEEDPMHGGDEGKTCQLQDVDWVGRTAWEKAGHSGAE